MMVIEGNGAEAQVHDFLLKQVGVAPENLAVSDGWGKDGYFVPIQGR